MNSDQAIELIELVKNLLGVLLFIVLLMGAKWLKK